MNQHEISILVTTLNATFRFVGLSADWIDECWALGHSKAVGIFIRFVDIDTGEPDPYFELVQRSICLYTGECHAEQLDTFIEGDFNRLMHFIEHITTPFAGRTKRTTKGEQQ